MATSAEWSALQAELQAATCLGEHTYLLTQAVLATASQASDAVALRLLQQVRVADSALLYCLKFVFWYQAGLL